jgi:hypothetical protein
MDANGHLQRLQEEYPIGNNDMYPHFRTLKRTIGGKVLYWELNLLRLRIWSNFLVGRCICFYLCLTFDLIF